MVQTVVRGVQQTPLSGARVGHRPYLARPPSPPALHVLSLFYRRRGTRKGSTRSNSRATASRHAGQRRLRGASPFSGTGPPSTNALRMSASDCSSAPRNGATLRYDDTTKRM